jgi:ubiquinone/menaquinone biosynthesis C-methylase UbiE
MNERVLSILCDPSTQEGLELRTEAGPDSGQTWFLVNTQSGRRFALREGIPVFLNEAEISGPNKKYQGMYDWIAPGYDFAEKLYAFLRRHDRRKVRGGFLGELEIHDGDRVLEVSVGTGANIPHLPGTVEFCGLDLSWGMLKKCQRNLRRWNREACLFYGEAEHLSFKDESFDVVVHLGGINFFSDKDGAIREMIRVAKRGTKIVISDETEKHVKSVYEKTPLTGKYFKNRKEAVSPPADLVPGEMLDVRLKEFDEGRLYCLTFRKPASPLAG